MLPIALEIPGGGVKPVGMGTMYSAMGGEGIKHGIMHGIGDCNGMLHAAPSCFPAVVCVVPAASSSRAFICMLFFDIPVHESKSK